MADQSPVTGNQPTASNQNQPGTVIQPAATGNPAEILTPPPALISTTGTTAVPPQNAQASVNNQPPAPTWEYRPAADVAQSSAPDDAYPPAAFQPSDDDESIVWSAAEFTHHEKSMLWYIVLSGAGIVFIAVIYLLTRDKITSVIIALAVIALAVFAGRKPRTQDYEVNAYGIRTGRQNYGFTDFKSFAVYEDGSAASVVLMPLKRFMPPLTIYLGPDVAEAVIGILGDRLPLLQRPPDSLDSLLRKLRF